MTNPEPNKTVNLDQYGQDPLPWPEVLERLEAEIATGKDTFTVLGTVTPEGRPHAAGVGAWWIDRTRTVPALFVCCLPCACNLVSCPNVSQGLIDLVDRRKVQT